MIYICYAESYPQLILFFFILIKGKKKFRSSLYTVERVKKEKQMLFLDEGVR